jgi:NADPH:quinone reductase-like Zn-dependent oxidoreductase
MRVYRFDRLDGLDYLTLHDEPVPEPQRGEVLVKVRVVSRKIFPISM